MTDQIEIVRGSGNIYRDLGMPDANVRQAKALLAAQIIKALDEDGLSLRQAEGRTGVNHSEFARIKAVKLDRFTFDRLMLILQKLGRSVDVSITVKPSQPDLYPAE